MHNVVVLPQYEFAFFCMPKVANTSVKSAILKVLGVDADEETIHRHPALNISTARKVYKCYMKFFKVTIVRNPFDRLVSCYESKVRDIEKCKAQGFSSAGFHYDMTFTEYIEQVCEAPFVNIHFQPQLPAIKYCGTILVDFIGFFEQLKESWAFIAKTVKFDLGELGHLNKTENRKPYREYYDDRTRRMVSEVFDCDISFFGYQF